jgi:calcineurin-like phosphoesterase
MDSDEPIHRFLTKVPRGRYEPATGPGTLSGLLVDIDDETGLAARVQPLRQGPWLAPAIPDV